MVFIEASVFFGYPSTVVFIDNSKYEFNSNTSVYRDYFAALTCCIEISFFSLNIFFFAKKSRTTTHGAIPIYLRVSINGERLEVTTNRFILSNDWSIKMARVKGNSLQAKEVNSYLDYLKYKEYEYEQDILCC